MKVLLIEDDARMAEEVVQALGSRGHSVSHILDGDRGREAALSAAIDVLITDRMLPGQDGLEIVQALRKAGRTTPVLVLSALDSVDERVRGLRAGSDDYLGKPFAIEELIARVESLGRRSLPSSETALKVEDLELDLLAREARRAGRDIELTAREFRLLECLVRHAGQVVTRAMLLKNVWDIHYDPQTNVVDVHVSRLRQAVDKEFEKPLIHTVRGVGYSLHG
ncbi:MAG: winged helix-turn-helix domain-containing protein [Steroidobacteraceae bacterium]|jgi:two-component system OmpR family response regulator